MKRSITLLAAVALILAAAWLHGAASEGSSNQGGIRIAYVDLDRVARDSQMVMQRVKSVQGELSNKQEVLKERIRERNELRDQLRRQESVLTVAQADQIRAKIRKLQDEIDYLTYQIDKVLKDTSRDIIEPVLDRVLESVERVAQASKVDLVLRGDLVLFASERVDLTDWVIRDLDRSLKAEEAKASPAQGPGRRSTSPAKTEKASSPKK